MTSLSHSLALPRHRTAPRAAFGQITRNEARLAWRRPIGLFGGIGIPLLLLVVFGQIPAFQQPLAALGGATTFDVYEPILIVFSLTMMGLMGLPIPLVTYRELGVLRRLSTTPVPPSWLLAAQGIVALAVAAIATFGIVVISSTAFGAPAPVNPGGLALSFLLAVAGIFPVGLLVAAVARTANGASVIGRLTFFPLIFFAGLWLPRQLMPGVLRDISNYTPVGAAVQALQYSIEASFPPAAPLLVLAAYAVVFGYLAKRFFRWE